MQTEKITSTASRSLEGLRVLDFTWYRSGPWASRWLGALGAEVIKVEWPQSRDIRGGNGRQHVLGFEPTLNTSGHFSDNNANKLSITLNTKTERGFALIQQLITISDIVIENFTYGVLERWGLSYEDMKKLRSDIIYISMSPYGHTGPERYYQTAGWGCMAQALSGLTFTSGLPGQPPAGWGWSYMGDTSGMYGAMYALSALYHRNMTGHGQHVDQSQWETGIPLNGAAFLDAQANGRSTRREGYPPGNRAHWPGTPLVNNYRGPTVAPHNAYKTSPGKYNDWCTIVCFSDDDWQRLVGVMGSPAWAKNEKFRNIEGRLENQNEIDHGIEEWTMTLDKYEIMERCQAAGVPSMPVQSTEDRVDNDQQIKHRELFKEIDHPVLGSWPLQNAPFTMSETPASNGLPGPLIGQHNKEVFEGLLGISHENLIAGFEDGTFWPKGFDMTPYPYLREMIENASLTQWTRNGALQNIPQEPPRKSDPGSVGALEGIRVLELSDEKGQWCGKLMGDLGADVIKIEPPGGESTRSVGPFYQDIPDRDRSLYFWHYNTSKRGITLDLKTEDGRRLFKKLSENADVILETFNPGYMASLGLGYDDLKKTNPGLIMCSLTPFGQTGPWKDYVTSDLLHMAAGGQMACCGYTEEDMPNAPPIAPGGGQAWHIASHYAYMAIGAALIYKSITGQGQYVDVSVHESCALTTEAHLNTYIYTKQVVRRNTGRSAAVELGQPITQLMCADGKYVNVGYHIASEFTDEQLRVLGDWMKEHGLSSDILEERYKNPDVITDNELLFHFVANMKRDDIYRGGQKRGFGMAAVWSPDDVMNEPHLEDRGFWTKVEHPEIGKTFIYPGPGGIFNGSPWRISRRAPLIGEHNEEILCGELGLTKSELAIIHNTDSHTNQFTTQ